MVNNNAMHYLKKNNGQWNEMSALKPTKQLQQSTMFEDGLGPSTLERVTYPLLPKNYIKFPFPLLHTHPFLYSSACYFPLDKSTILMDELQ